MRHILREFAAIIHLRDGFIRGSEFRPARDVLGMAVAKMGADIQLLHGPGLQDDLRGRDFDALNALVVGLGAGRPRGDPFGKHAVIQRVRLKTFAAFVRDRAGRFEEHQT